MRRIAALSSLLLAAACGHEDVYNNNLKAHAASPCHAQIDLSPPWEEVGKHFRALNLTLSSDGGGIGVPYHVTTKGPSFEGGKQFWNTVDEGSGPSGLKLLVKEGWQALQPAHANAVKLGGIFAFTGDGGISEVAINGQVCSGAISPGPKTQDEPSKQQTETKVTPPPAAAPASTPAAPAAEGDEEALKTTISGWIETLMDTPRQVPADNLHQAETRGGPGNYAKLADKDKAEIIAGIIYCAKTFLPQHISLAERAALICVDISAESAFRIGTSGMNPNAAAGLSTNLQQVTGSIWIPEFQKRGRVDGLHHYDGSSWNPADTQINSATDSLWDGLVLANWAISEQAKSGAGNPRAAEFGEDVGSLPHTWETGLASWCVGYPAARKGPGDPDWEQQMPHYYNMQRTDLKLIGFPESLLAAEF